MVSKQLVVIPTYNEVQNAPRLIESLLHAFSDVDILVVDDSSPDGTAAACVEAAGNSERFKILTRQEKAGLGSAYIFGFQWAIKNGYGSIIEMDADGSHRVQDLGLLQYAFASQNADLVIGSRWISGGAIENWPKERELLSRSANKYCQLALGIQVHDMTAGFRVYNAEILKKIDLSKISSSGYCFQIEMTRAVNKLDGRIIEVPITFIEREFGQSKMSKSIVIEAMLNVTKWGIKRLFGK